MASDPLTAAPSPGELYLLKLVAHIYLTRGAWPSWAWVEENMERVDLNAWAVLSAMPSEPTFSYGYVRHRRLTPPNAEDRIWLTLAGLRHVDEATEVVSKACKVIGALGTARANAVLDPFSTAWPEVNAAQLGPIVPTVFDVSSSLDMLPGEPASWRCQRKGPDDNWSIELSPDVRRFAGVSNIGDYLEHLAEFLARQAGGASHPPPAVSPFTLPASIDYLDTIWQLRLGKPLTQHIGMERSARLASDVSTPDEADSALSALAEVLKGLRAPGVTGIDGHPLKRLRAFFEPLPEESHPRLHDALDVLTAATQVRAGAQHFGAQRRAVPAYTQLGLSFPVVDWSAAWRQIQAVVAHAFDVIREEIQANGDVLANT